MRKTLEIICSVLLAVTMVLGGSVHAQTWQQQQRQQDFMRQRQIDQQRQDAMREQMRRAEQQRVQDQIRQQQRDLVRQQQIDNVRRQQVDAARQNATNQARQDQVNAARQLATNNAKQQQRDDLRQQGRLSVARPGDQAARGPFRASNGIAQAPRQPTPAEAKRGFTGKVTPDGKALVRFQNRVVTVPASRIGVMPRPTATGQVALATGWSPQKQASINAEVRKIAAGTGAGKPGITGTFNAVAMQARIADAGQKRLLPPSDRYASLNVEENRKSSSQARHLNLELASRERTGALYAKSREDGEVMAGAGNKRKIDVLPRLVSKYGGGSDDWVKKKSSAYVDRDGLRHSIHWYENVKTGERFEKKVVVDKKGIGRVSEEDYVE